ncbi:MAG: transposase domain-containing protein [Acidiferrobacterales bacterium]
MPKANGIEQHAYLNTSLRRIAARASRVEHIEALLPWNAKPTFARMS